MAETGPDSGSLPPSPWPVLKSYDQQHLLRIAMPLGGIGTGTVSLGGRGNLQDWEVVNRPAKGFTPRNTFFALFAEEEGKPAVTRALEGPIDPAQYEGAQGCNVPNHNLPRFRSCQFDAAYPLAQVTLSDPDVPVGVRLEAFNPLLPPNADDSGLPIAVLRFVIHNHTQKTVKTAVCASLQNFIGADGSDPKPDWAGRATFDHKFQKNHNAYKHDHQVHGIYMTSEGLDRCAETWGSLALALAGMHKESVSYRTLWPNLSWGDSLLDFWDDFSQDGQLEPRADVQPDPAGPADWTGSNTASLAASFELAPGAFHTLTFVLAWHFPNRKTWTSKPADSSAEPGEPQTCDCLSDPNTIGNYYTTKFSDAWDVVTLTVPRLAELEDQTVEFVNALIESDLPPVVKEAALFNLSSLRSQTCFRTPDGRFFGFEGCNDNSGCCPGSCTHVWNYEQVTPFLFGGLARTMREVEFHFSTDERGLMSFRTHLPLDPAAADSGKASGWGKAAADGQMGCLMKLYRDWQLSGDDTLLRNLWPQARKALEFCWIPGGWDADQDGVMEGCQHNTMDVEYYGPNPQMGIWYLGALRAMGEMAAYLGEKDFASRSRSLFEKGSAWLDEHLFNGDYYEHEIRPPQPQSETDPGLRIGMGGIDASGQPELQLGRGCLVDQLVGQYVAHVCGLGYLVDEAHVRKALQSIMAFNFRPNFFNHFNHLRTFVLNGESALVMASYPRGERPRRPFPYFNEVMTGFEYCAGVHMLYEGQQDNGLKVIKAIRSRYDGLRRSPFDEAECGHHYARAMASWAAVLALTGFHYSGVEKKMTFARMVSSGQWFWSTGDAWGVCHQKIEKKGMEVILEVKGGRVSLGNITITGFGAADLFEAVTLEHGDRVKVSVEPE